MLGHFPAPYPDELFYSMCARFSDRMRYPSRSSVTNDLFGDRVTVTVGLQAHLARFVARLPPGHPLEAERLIDGHSLLPLCAPFLPQGRLGTLRQQMKRGSAYGISPRAGLWGITNVPAPLWFRFCPLCVEDDRECYGETYWHRIHQVPGVDICSIHAVWLENSIEQSVHAPEDGLHARHDGVSAHAVRCHVSVAPT